MGVLYYGIMYVTEQQQYTQCRWFWFIHFS